MSQGGSAASEGAKVAARETGRVGPVIPGHFKDDPWGQGSPSRNSHRHTRLEQTDVGLALIPQRPESLRSSGS